MAAIKGLIDQVQQNNPELTIAADLPDEDAAVDEEVSLVIYRICQQALHNLQRHAQATAARVVLHVEPDHVALTVADNGVGFTPPVTWLELARDGHMGIVGMEERMRALGGSFELHSAPGNGTTIHAVTPLPTQINADTADTRPGRSKRIRREQSPG